MKKIIYGLLSLGLLQLSWAEEAKIQLSWAENIRIGDVDAKDVELEIVLIVDQNGRVPGMRYGRATGMRYIFTNNSKDILRVSPPNLRSSRLIIRTPNGKIDDYVLGQEKINISALPLVHPGTSKYWDEHWGESMNMLRYLRFRMVDLGEILEEEDNPYKDEKTGELMTGDYEFFWRIERHIPTEEALRSWWLYCQRAFSLGDSVDEEDFRDWGPEIPKQDFYGGKDADLSSNKIIFTVPEEDIEDAEKPK